MTASGPQRPELTVQQWFANPSNRVYAAQQGDGTDPTRTKTLRAKYAAHAWRLLRELKGEIRAAVVDADVFGLTADTRFWYESNQTPPQRGFDFPSDPEKIAAFMEWLREREHDGFLETHRVPVPGRPSSTSTWADTYLRASYSKGVSHAEAAAASAGVTAGRDELDLVFRAPKHADSAALAFTRNYRELQGVTDAMDQQISRTLADGLVTGKNPNELARELNGAVDMGMTRARLVAQTEMVRSFNEAALNRYEDLGIEGVEAQVELATAGDDKVCDDCAHLQGDVYSIADARGVLPIHPRCRCTFLPVV